MLVHRVLTVEYLTDSNTQQKQNKTNKQTSTFITHQTHNEKSDWSRAFNQFTIAYKLDMINAISEADIAFIMSCSKTA